MDTLYGCGYVKGKVFLYGVLGAIILVLYGAIQYKFDLIGGGRAILGVEIIMYAPRELPSSG